MAGAGLGLEPAASAVQPGTSNKRRHSRTPSGSRGQTAGPATICLKSEDELVLASRGTSSSSSRCPQDSTFGVRSLEDALSDIEKVDSWHQHQASFHASQESIDRRSAVSPSRHAIFNLLGPRTPLPSSNASSPPVSSVPSPVRPLLRHSSTAILAPPFTPLHLQSPGSASTPISSPQSGSLRSFRLSDEDSLADDAASRAILSSGDEEEEEAVEYLQHMNVSQGEAPQLVMPSINMPVRRPFTEKGKEVGKLKILVAGSKGELHRDLYRYVECIMTSSTRCGQVFSHSIHCQELRGHCPRRSILQLYGLASCIISANRRHKRDPLQSRSYRPSDGSVCKHQSLPVLVVRRHGRKSPRLHAQKEHKGSSARAQRLLHRRARL